MCERDGVDVGGRAGKIYPIVLANKGDWSYLVSWLGLCDCFVIYMWFIQKIPKDIVSVFFPGCGSIGKHPRSQEWGIQWKPW